MIEAIALEKTKQIPELIQDYIQFNPQLKEFVTDFPSISNAQNFISQKSKTFSVSKRNVLVKQIKEQYISNGIEVPEVVDLIKENNTFTVTTGHQLSLFGGPQFFIHKIVSTIKMCSILKEEYPEYNFIPVFWMATEDHDYDEINSVQLFGRKIASENKAQGPMGRISCSNFQGPLDEIKLMLGETTEVKQLLSVFSDAMKQHNWAQSTRFWVHHFFKSYPLIILDGDDKELKKEFIPLAEKELFSNLQNEIEDTSKKLDELGYKTQINPREINLFYIENNLRERIVREDNQFSILNTNIQFTEDELKEELYNHPEKFSPNVALRPVYQETILPNIAYIGGPGETAYWLQLKSYFNSFTTPFPMVILRDFFTWISQKEIKQLEENSIEFVDLFKNEDQLKKQLALQFSSHEIDFSEEKNLILELEQKLLEKVTEIDPSIIGMVKADMNGVSKITEKLEKRLIKAIKQKEEVNINRILKIQQRLLPGGKLNERSESFIPFLIQQQEQYLIKLIESANCFDTSLKVLV